jgi:hypothetical protein
VNKIACSAGATQTATDLPLQAFVFGDIERRYLVCLSVHRTSNVRLCRASMWRYDGLSDPYKGKNSLASADT